MTTPATSVRVVRDETRPVAGLQSGPGRDQPEERDAGHGQISRRRRPYRLDLCLGAAAQRNDADVAGLPGGEIGKIEADDRARPAADLGDQLLARIDAQERSFITPRLLQPRLQQFQLRGVDAGLALRVLDHLRGEQRRRSKALELSAAEIGGDGGRADIGVELQQRIGIEDRRDALELYGVAARRRASRFERPAAARRSPCFSASCECGASQPARKTVPIKAASLATEPAFKALSSFRDRKSRPSLSGISSLFFRDNAPKLWRRLGFLGFAHAAKARI